MGIAREIIKKVPLDYASRAMTNIYDLIESSEDLEEYLIAEFRSASLDLAEAVDRRIAVMKRFKSEIGHLTELKTEIEGYLATVKKADVRLKEHTMFIMTANEQLTYKGNLGRLALQNSPVRVEFTFPVETKTISNCISDAVLLELDVPEKYITKHVHYSINREAVKTYLNQSPKVSLPWARLMQGQHIRIRRV